MEYDSDAHNVENVSFGSNAVDSGPVAFFNEHGLFNPNVVNVLSKLDDNHMDVYGKFLKNARESNENLTEASNHLSALLANLSPQETVTAGFQAGWKDVLTKGSSDEKSLFIDRMKAIFALDKRATDKNALANLVKSRGDEYTRLKGSNGKPFPAISDAHRQSIVAELSKQDTIVPEVNDRLIGFTAFYRKAFNNQQNEEARGLSMTAVGNTNVLGGITTELTGEEHNKAREWMLGSDNMPGNLEKNVAELSHIANVLSEKIRIKLTKDDVLDLLKRKEVEKDGEIIKME